MHSPSLNYFSNDPLKTQLLSWSTLAPPPSLTHSPFLFTLNGHVDARTFRLVLLHQDDPNLLIILGDQHVCLHVGASGMLGNRDPLQHQDASFSEAGEYPPAAAIPAPPRRQVRQSPKNA